MCGGKDFKEQAEQWKRENTNPGGGIVQGAKGMRYDDHSDTLKKMQEERQRRSEQKNNPGSSMRR